MYQTLNDQALDSMIKTLSLFKSDQPVRSLERRNDRKLCRQMLKAQDLDPTKLRRKYRGLDFQFQASIGQLNDQTAQDLVTITQ
jgi:hypothetical protein